MRAGLWERRPRESDFLSLRVGVADLPASLTVETPLTDGESLPKDAQALLDRHLTLPMVPATVGLQRVGALGLVGPERCVDGLGMWLALQAAVLHSPRELSIAAAIDPDQRERWEWLKWLPHTRGELLLPGGQQLAGDTRASQELLSKVAELVSVRHGQARESLADMPAMLLFLDEDLLSTRAETAEIMSRGPAVGVFTIWLGHVQRGLPGECRSFVVLDPAVARLTLVLDGGDRRVEDVALDCVEHDLALEVARAISSVKDIGAPGARGVDAFDGAGVRNYTKHTTNESAGDPHANESEWVTIAPFGWGERSACSPSVPRDGVGLGDR